MVFCSGNGWETFCYFFQKINNIYIHIKYFRNYLMYNINEIMILYYEMAKSRQNKTGTNLSCFKAYSNIFILLTRSFFKFSWPFLSPWRNAIRACKTKKIHCCKMKYLLRSSFLLQRGNVEQTIIGCSSDFLSKTTAFLYNQSMLINKSKPFLYWQWWLCWLRQMEVNPKESNILYIFIHNRRNEAPWHINILKMG